GSVPEPITTDYPGITIDNANGRARLQPVYAPTITWTVNVRLEGDSGDPCNQVVVGSLQNIIMYRALVRWGSGYSRVSRAEPCAGPKQGTAAKMPARDATQAWGTALDLSGDFADPLWYSGLIKKQFSACGTEATIVHQDSPATSTFDIMDPQTKNAQGL